MTLKVIEKSLKNSTFSEAVKLALPVAIQSAFVAVLALSDVVMVSDFGEESTAAVGVASKWHFVAIMIMAGLSGANGTLVAQFMGKGDLGSAKAVTMEAVRFGARIIIPITIVIIVGSQWLMQLQTSDLLVIELGKQYLIYSAPLLILTHLVIVLESSMRSSGDAFCPLVIGSMKIILNIGLNYWLIKGGWGVEPLGVTGAALATTISRTVQLIIMVVYLNMCSHWLVVEEEQGSTELNEKYHKLALPLAYNSVVWACGTMCYQMIFGHMGTAELAVYSLIGPFESMCHAMFFGVSVACSIMLGHRLGRNDFMQAGELARRYIVVVVGAGLFLTIILLIAREAIVGFLGLNSPELYSLAYPAITVVVAVLTLRMTNMLIINGILRAGGENRFCLKTDFIAMWLVGVPLCFFGAYILSLPFHMVYLLMIAEEIVKFVLCTARYSTKIWQVNLTS